MTDYVITFARSARKELEALERDTVQRIIVKIEQLSRQPHPAGSRKLQGTHRLWRLRVGDYRVIYSLDDGTKTVDVIRVRHRRDAYR